MFGLCVSDVYRVCQRSGVVGRCHWGRLHIKYPFKMHHKLKSRENLFAHNFLPSRPLIVTFFTVICAKCVCVWINYRVNTREAGDLRRYRAHYDVTLMLYVIAPRLHRSQYLQFSPGCIHDIIKPICVFMYFIRDTQLDIVAKCICFCAATALAKYGAFYRNTKEKTGCAVHLL